MRIAWSGVLLAALASACGGGLSGPSTATPAAVSIQTLDDLFVPANFRDASDLELEIGEPIPDDGLIATPVAFTSFRWEGEVWRHRAIWFRPGPDSGDEAAATAGDLPLAAVVDHRALARAAARRGVPALWIQDGFPGPRYGVADESKLMSYSLSRYFKSDDGRWVGYGWLARVFVRGVTVVEQLPGGTDRVAISGCSKRGVASWIAAGVDERIRGAMPACWNGAGGEAWLRMKAERWGEDYDSLSAGSGRGPAALSARAQIKLLQGPQGRRLLEWTDPTQFPERLRDKSFVIAVGTSDPLYPPMSDGIYLPLLPPDTRMALMPNVGHGRVGAHEAAWGMLLDRLRQADGTLPEIRAELDAHGVGAGRVLAELATGSVPPASATLWHVEDPSGRYHDVRWKGIPMQRAGAGWSAELPGAGEAFQGWFVAVEWDHGSGYLTTSFQERRADPTPEPGRLP